MSAVPLAQLSSPFSLFLSPLLWPPLLLANPPFNPAFPALDSYALSTPSPASLPSFSAPSDIVALIMVDISAEGDILFVRSHARTQRTHVRTHIRAEMDGLPSTVSRRPGIDICDAFYSGNEACRALLYRVSFLASKAPWFFLFFFFFSRSCLLFAFLYFFVFLFHLFLSLRRKYRVPGITDPTESHFRLECVSLFRII